MMIRLQHINSLGRDEWMRTAGGDGCDDRSFNIRLRGCSTRARLIDLTATHVARPKKIEATKLYEDRYGTIILIGWRNCSAANDTSITRDTGKHRSVAEQDLLTDGHREWRTGSCCRRGGIPLRHA